MIVDKINTYLAGSGKTVDEALLAEVAQLARYSFERQFGEREEKQGTLRLSSIGRCLRQQAYNVLGVPPNGKEIDSRSKMVFFQGDLAELAIIYLAKLAGCDISVSGLSQEKVDLMGVKGHPDGVYHNGADYLLEAKSMSSYGFAEFQRGEIDPGYRYQINSYMEAKGLEKTIVIGLNKDAGVLHEMLVEKDPAIVADIRARIETLRQVALDKLPPRPYAPNDKGFYPWNCLYCAHWKTCLPGAEKVLVGRSYKLKETKGGTL